MLRRAVPLYSDRRPVWRQPETCRHQPYHCDRHDNIIDCSRELRWSWQCCSGLALDEPTRCRLWEANDDAGSISSADCRSLGMLFLNATERRTSSFKHDTKSAHVSVEPSGPDFPTSHPGIADLDGINQSLCVTQSVIENCSCLCSCCR